MPADDTTGNDPQERLIAAAHAAASWARARRAMWTSAPFASGTATTPPTSAPSVPAAAANAFSPPPHPPLPDMDSLIEDAAPPPVPAFSPAVRRWLTRGAIAGAATVATVIGGWYAWRALPERTAAVEPAPAAVPSARRATGTLHVNSTPPGARVVVDGAARGVTPLDLTELKPGRHEVVLHSDAGSVTRTVTVAANATATIDEAIFSGFVTVYAPFDVTVSEGGRVLKADDRQQIMLAAGGHDLRIANGALGYEVVRKVAVKPGAATIIQLTPEPSPLSVTASEAADVWLDGARLGATPLTAAPVPLGIHEVAVRRAAGGERRFTLTFGVKPVSLAVDFSAR